MNWLINRFRDRSEGGQFLASKLESYADRPDAIVLALPRGGEPWRPYPLYALGKDRGNRRKRRFARGSRVIKGSSGLRASGSLGTSNRELIMTVGFDL